MTGAGRYLCFGSRRCSQVCGFRISHKEIYIYKQSLSNPRRQNYGLPEDKLSTFDRISSRQWSNELVPFTQIPLLTPAACINMRR